MVASEADIAIKNCYRSNPVNCVCINTFNFLNVCTNYYEAFNFYLSHCVTIIRWRTIQFYLRIIKLKHSNTYCQKKILHQYKKEFFQLLKWEIKTPLINMS
jgi:hypothetical protein